MLSVNGRIDIQRTRWQQGKGIARTAGPKSVVPVDALLDKAQATVSLGVCELCCRLGIAGGSMARSLEEIRGLPPKKNTGQGILLAGVFNCI